jgi:hypothetical protein
VGHGGRNLPPGLNVVGHGSRNLPPWGLAPNVYFSKFLVRAFIFRKSKKNYKKVPVRLEGLFSVIASSWAVAGSLFFRVALCFLS